MNAQWITQWASVLVGVLSLIVALFVFSVNRISAKRKSAFDILIAEMENAELHHAERIFLTAALSQNLLDALKPDSEIRDAVRYVLNYYEVMCIAINLGLVHEGICKSYARSTVISRWERAADFITELRQREANPAIYGHLEKVATRWMT